MALDNGHNGALLDSGWALETVGVDTTEELSLEVHRIEGVNGLIVVGLDSTYRYASVIFSMRHSIQLLRRFGGDRAIFTLTLGKVLKTLGISHICG